MLIVSSRIQIPDSELRFSYARSSGPGGQNVNKVASKAILHWSTQSESISDTVRQRLLELFPTRVTNAGDFVISSDRFRDQRQKDRKSTRLNSSHSSVSRMPSSA